MASYGHSGLMYPWFSMLLHYHVGMIGPMLVKYRAILKDIANSVQTKQRQDTAKSEQCARSLGCVVTKQGIDTSRLRQMAAILQMAFSNTICMKIVVMIQISLNFDSKCPISNKPWLVHVMAWRLTSDKPLCEPLMLKFTDTYMRHSAKMS